MQEGHDAFAAQAKESCPYEGKRQEGPERSLHCASAEDADAPVGMTNWETS